jgi:hypothetical protein
LAHANSQPDGTSQAYLADAIESVSTPEANIVSSENQTVPYRNDYHHVIDRPSGCIAVSARPLMTRRLRC